MRKSWATFVRRRTLHVESTNSSFSCTAMMIFGHVVEDYSIWFFHIATIDLAMAWVKLKHLVLTAQGVNKRCIMKLVALLSN